jgi:membrane protein required for colicin V production
MTWVDWVIVVVIAGAVIGGISQGLLRSLCSLCGLIFGLMLAAWNYGRIAAIVQPIVRIEAVADAIGFLLIALLIMAIANLVGLIISKTVQKMGLGCLDRLAGGVFGFVQGALLVMLSILVVLAFFPKAEWLAEAKLPKYFYGACQATTHLSSGELANRVRHGIDSMQEHAPEWLHPPGSQI